jgi:hypothetical protein
MNAPRAAYGKSAKLVWLPNTNDIVPSAGQAGQLQGPYQLKMVMPRPMTAQMKPRLSRIITRCTILRDS